MTGHGIYDGSINIGNPEGLYNNAEMLLPLSPPDGKNRLVSQDSAEQWDFRDSAHIDFSVPGKQIDPCVITEW